MLEASETNSTRNQLDMAFTLEAMRQQFERTNMILREMRDRQAELRDRMERQEASMNEVRDRMERRPRREEELLEEFGSEHGVESPNEEEIESDFGIGRNRNRRDR